MKNLIILLTLVFSFSSCTKKEKIYVQDNIGDKSSRSTENQVVEKFELKADCDENGYMEARRVRVLEFISWSYCWIWNNTKYILSG